MSDLARKIDRKTTRFSNQLVRPNKAQIAELSDLINTPPLNRPEIDEWAAKVKNLLQDAVINRISKEDISAILGGVISYRKTGITPAATQAALVRSFEHSSGLFQDILHKVLFENIEPEYQSIQSALFGTVDVDVVKRIQNELTETGYSVFPTTLSPDLVEQVRVESQSFDYLLKGDTRANMSETSGINASQPPDCVSAYAKPHSVENSQLLQSICNDELFKTVCSTYLGAPAVAIDSTFWYTFPSRRPSSENAQLFHYDLDTIRWVKVFVYLSDVGTANGPHEYVASSHKPENMPPGILVRNYSRIEDTDIDKFYPSMRRSLTGAAGTVIFGDTRCFHKGNAVTEGHRLIYSPIYAPSKFGYVHG